jgi:hypothetical protein
MSCSSHYPLAMISPPARNFFEFQLRHVKSLRDMKAAGVRKFTTMCRARHHDRAVVSVFDDRGDLPL